MSTPKKKPKFAEWRPAFLEALREWGNVTHAATVAGIDRSTAYKARERNSSFLRQWDDAIEHATDVLEMEARRRAERGVRRMKFHKGVPIMVPVLGEDGEIVLEKAVDSSGEAILKKDGSPLMVPRLTPYLEHEYSDTLMIFLLKAHRPKKFRDNIDITSGGEKLETAVKTYVTISPDDWDDDTN